MAKAELVKVAAERDEYRTLVLHLREEVERLRRGLLGQKAERLPKNDAQLSLAILEMAFGSQGNEPPVADKQLIGPHERRRPARKACDFWTDSGEGTFDLKYLRNKEKEEIDFLIVRDGKPWLPVEVKLNDTEPLGHWKKFVGYLGCRRALQLVCKPSWFRRYTEGDAELIVASAGDALRYFA